MSQGKETIAHKNSTVSRLAVDRGRSCIPNQYCSPASSVFAVVVALILSRYSSFKKYLFPRLKGRELHSFLSCLVNGTGEDKNEPKW